MGSWEVTNVQPDQLLSVGSRATHVSLHVTGQLLVNICLVRKVMTHRKSVIAAC